MDESLQRRRRRSKPIKEQSFLISKFGEHVVLCARGIKPAQWLSERIRVQGGKCSERHANLIIAGKRKPNTRAALAVYADIVS